MLMVSPPAYPTYIGRRTERVSHQMFIKSKVKKAYSVGEVHPLVGSLVHRRTQHPEESLRRVVEGQTGLHLRRRVRLGARELNLIDKNFGLFVDERLTFLVVQEDLYIDRVSI